MRENAVRRTHHQGYDGERIQLGPKGYDGHRARGTSAIARKLSHNGTARWLLLWRLVARRDDHVVTALPTPPLQHSGVHVYQEVSAPKRIVDLPLNVIPSPHVRELPVRIRVAEVVSVQVQSAPQTETLCLQKQRTLSLRDIHLGPVAPIWPEHLTDRPFPERQLVDVFACLD